MSLTSASPPEPQTHPKAWFILALILCAEVMDLLDSTIVNVAAPSISHQLGSSTTALQWITGGYSLTFAVFLIAGARLGDRFGRRALFQVGAWGFVACSALCAVAPDTTTLIIGRLLQGGTAAMLIPQGFGILFAAFAPGDIGKAFSIFGPVVGLAAVAGPVLGGALVSANLWGAGWRLVFLVNLPIGVFAAVGANRLFPRTREEKAPGLDLAGIGLIGAAALLITYPLIQGREAGWPAWTYMMLVGGVLTLGILMLWTRARLRAGREPVIRPGIFRHRGFSAGVIVTLVFFGGSFGLSFVLTLFLQLGLGYSALHAGLTSLPYAVGSSLGALVGAALLVPKLGRGVLYVGNGLLAAGVILLLVVLTKTHMHVTSWELAGPLLLWGLGLGLVVAPLFDFVLASLGEDEIGSGSGVLNALQQLGTAIGVAVIGTIFFSAASNHTDTAGSPDYVGGLEHGLEVGLGITAAMFLLISLLPKRAREEEQADLAGATAEGQRAQ